MILSPVKCSEKMSPHERDDPSKEGLSMKEQKKLLVLNQLGEGGLVGWQAASVLGISLRHVRRLIAAYRKEGAAALAHGNRGRKPCSCAWS